MLRMALQRWKMVVAVVCLYTVLLGYYAVRARTLAKANESLAVELAGPTSVAIEPEQLVLLRKEHDRLESDVRTIAELKATLGRLTNDLPEQSKAAAEVWTVRSNALQLAIEKERSELVALVQWSRDQDRMKLRAAAEARLAEKAAMNLDPVKEQERTGKILREIAVTTQQRMELVESFRKSGDKSAEAQTAFRAKLQEINTAWFKATQELGADTPLYEELPVKLEDYNNPKAELFRSFFPDPHGTSVTVYLDGTVEWAPSK